MNSFVLYGATGYTGELIAREAVRQGLRPVLAGRSVERLRALASELGLDWVQAGLENLTPLVTALQATPVLLNCAGPFARTQQACIDACLQAQAHYLDLAGEVPEFSAVAAHHETAQRTGIMLLPGVGFGIVPSDCLAAALRSSLPDANHLTLALWTVGGVSRGTLVTLLKDLHRPGVQRVNGQLVPATVGERSRSIDFGSGLQNAVYNPWRADLFTAFYTTGIPSIETYMVLPAPLVFAGRRLGWLLDSPAGRWLLQRLTQNAAAGPDAATRATGRTVVWGEVRNAQGQRVSARLHGPEAYDFTTLTAVEIARRVAAGESRAGFVTPAALYGAEFVTHVAGVRLETV